MTAVYLVKSSCRIMAAFEKEESANEFSSQHAGSFVEHFCVFKDMNEMKEVL